ncbi:MAG: hypothetical protein KIH08_15630 [Candidatus Freyarchaeota archaeon]|nr:hypothetical protein [Candidatus Jordarchaeia archaeon]MBS7281290.1 hypothetical protein [Candidatus Jordarchaeia archaeon]
MSEFVFKVLVIGPREEVKDRFLLSMDSNSYFLECFKSIVGVSLQVNIINVKGRMVKVQIWDVYDSPPFKSMFHHYFKGAYGAIILLTRRGEVEASKYIEEVYKHCGEIPVLVIIVDERSPQELSLEYGDSYIEDPTESLKILSERIFERKSEPLYLRLSYNALPPYAQLLSRRRLETLATIPLNVPLIREVLEGMGFHAKNDEVVLRDEKGIWTVDLRTGEVYLQPTQCDKCERDCVKKEKVCMILASPGWSSNPDISQSDLLIIAKVYAIANKELPPDVQEKVNEILVCPYKENKKPERRRRKRTTRQEIRI